MALKSGRVGIHPSQVDPITGMLLSSPGGASDLSDLDDVSIDNPEAGQQLIYNGNKWENQYASISPLSLAQLRDVEITDLQDGDFITYDATSEKWVNTGEAPGPTVIQQTVTIYSAIEDVISYTDIYGATQTEAFAANSDHKTITVDIYESGSNITFISSVAKNPDSLSDAYSKTVTVTNATTAIYVMPDATKTLYWWGYESSDFEDVSNANGWSYSAPIVAPTHNANTIRISASSGQICGVGTKNSVSGNDISVIATGVTASSGNYAFFTQESSKTLAYTDSVGFTSGSLSKLTRTITDGKYYQFGTNNNRACDISAMWYE